MKPTAWAAWATFAVVALGVGASIWRGGELNKVIAENAKTAAELRAVAAELREVRKELNRLSTRPNGVPAPP